jgi:hypothetical protein
MKFGWVDFSRVHRDKVMGLMDMFREQGVIDELGLGTIRDSLSDILFPGTSTIQTKAKYFVLIPWIIQEIEKSNQIERFHAELERLEIEFTKTLRRNSGTRGVIGATLQNANPKRKPSSIYWNGLRMYGVLKFPGSINDYAAYLKHYYKKLKNQRKALVESNGNVPGDDKDAAHLYQEHLWAQLPRPSSDWKENLTINLTEDEAKFLRERIIISNPDSLWAYTLNHISEIAKNFTGINDFLSIQSMPDNLKELVILASNFNAIMQGALIRYNLLIQLNRVNGRKEELLLAWGHYWAEMQNFNWNEWNIERLWHFCPYTQRPTRNFVATWIVLVKESHYNEMKGDQLIRNRELKLKGIKRARLYDKAIAQKQQSLTGFDLLESGSVSYLTYRWATVKTFLNDIQNGLTNHAATKQG